MNRTKRLMTAVTASLLLTGTLPASGAMAPPQDQTAPAPDESWKTDPNVGSAADTIGEWLMKNAASPADAKSQQAIEKMFPTLGASLVGNALQRMMWEASVKRTGDGNASSPYRYYIPHSSGG